MLISNFQTSSRILISSCFSLGEYRWIFFSEIYKDNHKFLKGSVAIWQEKVFDIYKNSAPLGSNSHTFFMCCAAHQLCFKTAYSERQTLRYFKILSALMGQQKQSGFSLVFWKLIDWKSVKVSEIFLLHCQAILFQQRSEHIILFLFSTVSMHLRKTVISIYSFKLNHNSFPQKLCFLDTSHLK